MKKTMHSKHGKLISEKMAQIRKNSGLTQRALAEKLNREPSLVAHCELGERRVDLAEFYWICKACGASPEKEAADLMKKFARI
jgi:transcriptional regulator with XRE-family HTH domain